MMPLSTIATSPLSPAVSGCAFSSVTRPCVAQRVWPMPAVEGELTSRALRLRFSSLPTALIRSSPAGPIRQMPDES